MRNILIIGAGRSASSLIQYLLNKSEQEQLHLTIADIALELAQRKTNNHPNATAIAIDISNENQRKAAIEKADIVISMLPAHLHIEVAKDCIVYKKHLVTASYISDAMQELDAAAKENNLVPDNIFKASSILFPFKVNESMPPKSRICFFATS